MKTGQLPKLRILLADDHETVRAGLKAILSGQTDMEVVGEAADGEAAVAQARKLNPDVVVMDLSMPGMNGLRTATMLRQECPGARIVTLTRHSESGFVRQLLQAGVSAYVLKQSRSVEVLEAIRAAATNRTFLDPAIVGKVVGEVFGLSAPTGTDAPRSADVHLSPREEEVLRQVAWGYSQKEIAGTLQVSVKTIESHKANAMHKLGMKSRIDVVRYALLRGWLEEN